MPSKILRKIDEKELLKKYEGAKRYAERNLYYDTDKEDFPSWVVIKALSTKSRYETSFKLLTIDYLREAYGRKGIKHLESKRALKYARYFSDYEDSGGPERLASLSVTMDKPEGRDITGRYRNDGNTNFGNIRCVKRSQEIICKLYFDYGLNEVEIGKRFNVSESRISQILSPYRKIKIAQLAVDKFRNIEPLEMDWL